MLESVSRFVFCQAVTAQFDQVGIELCSGSDFEDSVSYAVSCLLIDCVRYLDGVECVGNRENSCLERNECSAYPIGIPKSIPSFVVMCDNHRSFPEKTEGFKPLRSDSWMTLDRGIRLGVDISMLTGNLRGKRQEADVVKERGER